MPQGKDGTLYRRTDCRVRGTESAGTVNRQLGGGLGRDSKSCPGLGDRTSALAVTLAHQSSRNCRGSPDNRSS